MQEKVPQSVKPKKVSKAAKVKEPKLKPWKPLSKQAVVSTLSAAVHFSSRPVNTNAKASGVRMASGASLNLRLIGLITTGLNRRVVDYQDGAVAGSLLSRCASVIEGTIDREYKDVPPEQVLLIQEHAKLLDAGAEAGTASVDARLRQVLFPTAAGYVALTPLHSSVFSAHLRTQLQAEAERRAEAGDPMQRPKTLLLVGGSKAQNVGRIALVGAMQRPLLFGAPKESPSLRAAYALFYKGVRIQTLVQRRSLSDLAEWREDQRLESGQLASSATLRQQERELLNRIGREAMETLQAHRAALLPYVELLGGWASEQLDDFTRSLLDEDMRTSSWSRDLARSLLRLVEGYKTSKDARPMAGFGDIDDYLDMIAETLK